MVQNGRLGVLTFKEFSECIGGELEDVMVKNEHGHEAKYIKKNAEKQKADHLKLEDMIHVKKLGLKIEF